MLADCVTTTTTKKEQRREARSRNDIPAKIIGIKRGGVMCQVDVQLEGTAYRMSSVMTLDSLDALGVKEGDVVHVVAKAVNVLLMKE